MPVLPTPPATTTQLGMVHSAGSDEPGYSDIYSYERVYQLLFISPSTATISGANARLLMKTKLLVSGIFLLGGVAIITNILRLYSIYRPGE